VPATVRLWTCHEESPKRDTAQARLPAPAHPRDRDCCLVVTDREGLIGRVVVNSPSPSMLPSDCLLAQTINALARPTSLLTVASTASFGSLFARTRLCLLRASPLSVSLTYRCHIYPDSSHVPPRQSSPTSTLPCDVRHDTLAHSRLQLSPNRSFHSKHT
jgi:hypothetical protein